MHVRLWALITLAVMFTCTTDVHGQCVTGQAYLIAGPPEIYHEWASDVGLSADWIFVAAPGVLGDPVQTQNGEVEVRHRATGLLARTLTIPPEYPMHEIRLGQTIAANGDYVLASSKYNHQGIFESRVHVFNATTGQMLRTLRGEPGGSAPIFGNLPGSIALHGNIAVVGNSYEDSRSGAAYIFDITTGARLHRLTASDRVIGEQEEFGNSVAVYGNLAVIGAWTDRYPCPDAASCVVGSAYVFDVTTGEQLFKLTPSDAMQGGMRFGRSIAMHGTTAVVGRYSSAFLMGSAYVFDVATGQLQAQLVSPNAAPYDQFGHTVAMNGRLAYVAAPGRRPSPNQGLFPEVDIFELASGQFQLTISPDEPIENSGFGQRLAADGDGFATGARNAIISDGSYGAAYLFNFCVEDSDGDGLLDSWETDGIPYDDGAGGTAYYMLPGADPMRKDLYVEVDAMAGLSFSQAAVDLVQFAFDSAPLANPDGSQGVTLHVLRDETDLPFVAVWQTDGCWPLDFDNFRSNAYGTTAERANPNAAALLEAKAKAYRYCVVASAFGPAAIGGCGQTPGDNFVMVGYADPDDAAAVFMHELGHNLGLQHGGGDAVNGKPNYPSIMNYANSYKYEWNQEYWRLDFSRVGGTDFATLDESALNELAGIGVLGGYYDNVFMPFGVNDLVGATIERRVKFVRLDGSATDFGDGLGQEFQDGMFDLAVVQDLNYAVMPPAGVSLPGMVSPGQAFSPHDDWARVNVGLALASTLGLRGVEPQYPDDELTIEAIEWIDQNFPLAPALCPGDVDRDGDIDFADLNVVLAAFNVAGLQLPGDIDRDGFVGFADLNIVISGFNTTCPGGGGGS